MDSFTIMRSDQGPLHQGGSGFGLDGSPLNSN